MNMSSLILFFNDTSNTQIYTYLHTLSLHDALPSYLWRLRRDRGQRDLVPTEEEALSYPYTPAELMHVEMNRQRNVVGTRSEEHTSELLSLKRISYAVFCLENKKKTISHLEKIQRLKQ